MPESSTLTVRLPTETKTKLTRLAGYTERTRSALATEAVSDYVDRELAIVEAIERGRAEVRTGQVYTNDEVFDVLDAEIEAARTGPCAGDVFPLTSRGFT